MAMAARVQGALEVALRGVDRMGWRRWIEHPQQGESEAIRVDTPQLDVSAVAVGGVDTPALADALRTVGLTDVLAAVEGVELEVLKALLARFVAQPDATTGSDGTS